MYENFEPVKDSIHDIIRSAGQDRQHIILGDTAHDDNAIAKFVSDQKTMVTLAETGVTHLFLELPKELQSYADLYADRAITKEDFIQHMSSNFQAFHQSPEDSRERMGLIADMIDNGKRVGIKTHFIDGGEGIKERSDYQRKVESAIVDFQTKNNLSDEQLRQFTANPENADRVRDHVESFMKNGQPDLDCRPNPIDRYQDEIIKNRLAGDALLAKRIEKTANGEKTAIFYGSMHGLSSKTDLDDQLAGSSLKITLQGKDDFWKEIETEDKPDIIHDVVTNKTLVDGKNPDFSDFEREVPAQDTPVPPKLTPIAKPSV